MKLNKLAVLIIGVLTSLSSNSFAKSQESPGRDWLIGFERTKMSTPEELLDGINYLRMQLRSGECSKKAGFTTLTVKNHLWDYPNSKKYMGFAWIRIPAPVSESCKIDIEVMGGWFKTLGMETISVTAPNEPSITREVRIKIDQTTLHCGLNKPHFPTGYSLSVKGRNLWSGFTDKCETYTRLLEEAKAQGGTLLAKETTSSFEKIDFTNTGNTSDYRLRWKLITVSPIRILLGGVVFEGAGFAPKEIAHE